ncbi:hypothetical protein ALI144C_24965 [Actinosynnema sp. ALI-1.44]|nr:hypothetical protein ALI144C_24965 [Actinosynnema sp. ALI-1.44]
MFLEVSEPSGADPLPAVWGERARLQVTDRPAAFLAAEFYDRLATGATVGRAMTKARLTTRRRWPDDPTWLANSVYAHPNTTVAFRLDVA